jgi:hypothetical protein
MRIQAKFVSFKENLLARILDMPVFLVIFAKIGLKIDILCLKQ